MTCYYCLQNKDNKCDFNVEGYPLPSNAECRHFWFDTGETEGLYFDLHQLRVSHFKEKDKVD
jgi:hypothetical protein